VSGLALSSARQKAISSQRVEERDAVEEPRDVPQHYARLAPVCRDHHDRGALAGSKARTIVAEAREVHGHERRDTGLATPAAYCQPGFAGRGEGPRAAARVGHVALGIVGRRREREQRAEHGAPRSPRVRRRELGGEQLGIVQDVEDR